MIFQFLAQIGEDGIMLRGMGKDPRQMIWVGVIILILLGALFITDYIRRHKEERRQRRRLLDEVSKCGLNQEERLMIADLVLEYDIRQPSAILDSVKAYDAYAQREIRKILQENANWTERQARLKIFDAIRRKILAHHGLDPLRQPKSGSDAGSQKLVV